MNDEHTAINEWKQERAPDGRLYFYNSRTGESAFHKPDELRIWEDKQKEKGLHIKDVIKNYQETKKIDETPVEKRAKPIAKESVTGTPWVIVWTSDGKHFFFNPLTKQSNWVMPADLEGNGTVLDLLDDPPHLRQEDEIENELLDGQDEQHQQVSSESSSDDDEEDEEEDITKKHGELIERLQELPLSERVEIFHELLSEQKLNKFSMWDEEKENAVYTKDVRFHILTDQEMINAFDDFMDKFIINGNLGKMAEDNFGNDFSRQMTKKMSPKDYFFQMLDDTQGKIHSKSTFRDVQLRCGKDRRWPKVTKSSDKVKYFREWSLQQRTGGKLDSYKEAFIDLLNEMNVAAYSTWNEAKTFLEHDKRYKNVASVAQRLVYYKEYMKDHEIKLDSIKKRSNKIEKYRAEIKAKNDLYKLKAVTKDVTIILEQMLLDLFKDKASIFFRQNYVAKFEDPEIKSIVEKDSRWETIQKQVTLQDFDRIFNQHVDNVIKKGRSHLKDLFSEKVTLEIPANMKNLVNNPEKYNTIWSKIWTQVQSDPRCKRFCDGNEEFAKKEFVRFQNDRYETYKMELRELFRETKLIDHMTLEKLRAQQEVCDVGQKPQVLKSIEDVLAFDQRWHNLQEEPNERAGSLLEYIEYCYSKGVDAPITKYRPKAKKFKPDLTGKY